LERNDVLRSTISSWLSVFNINFLSDVLIKKLPDLPPESSIVVLFDWGSRDLLY